MSGPTPLEVQWIQARMDRATEEAFKDIYAMKLERGWSMEDVGRVLDKHTAEVKQGLR